MTNHDLLTKQLKESLNMPKGTKEPTNARAVYVKFAEEEDIDLYNKLSQEAKAERRELGDHILLKLLKAHSTNLVNGATSAKQP